MAASAQGAESALRSMGNERFEVVGLHLRSVTYVNELSLVVATTAERYLEREGMAFPLPILVSLRPEAHADFEGDYRIRVEARGAVQLDIRWEAPLSLERTCRALAEALLVQYAVFNHGSDAPGQMRAWPVDALHRKIYFRLRPADIVTLLARARTGDTPPLASVVEALRRPADAAVAGDAGHGYWLLEAMQSAGLERRVLRGLFQQALAGIDIEEALTSAVQPPDPTADLLPLETWWSGQLAVLLGRDYEVVETMSASRDWLAALARFDTPLALESGEARLNLRSIRKHRAQAEVREWVQARYEILRIRMARINPAYYNAARSLGVLFEALLEDAPAHEHLHALTIYLSDWEDAKDMQNMIEEEMGR